MLSWDDWKQYSTAVCNWVQNRWLYWHRLWYSNNLSDHHSIRFVFVNFCLQCLALTPTFEAFSLKKNPAETNYPMMFSFRKKLMLCESEKRPVKWTVKLNANKNCKLHYNAMLQKGLQVQAPRLLQKEKVHKHSPSVKTIACQFSFSPFYPPFSS